MDMTVLDARNLSVTLNDVNILTDVSMHLEKGEFLGVIGPNGAGKSTFLKAIRGIVPTEEGEVTLLGQDINQMAEKEIARKLAFMQQSVQIGFGFTAEEVVTSARYPYLAWWENEGEEDKKIVEECMRFTGVYQMKDKVVNQLSGGERQRVLLAKVLAQETPIIFLDEPTASLDLVYQEEIFRYCRKLTESGKTIVMICHDLTMAARFCSRLMLIAKGKVQADGKPEDVLTAECLYHAFGIKSVVYRNPVSGNLDIYSYEKEENSNPHRLPAFICGSDVETGKIIRRLYELDVSMRLGIVSRNSVAAYCAEVFEIPFIVLEDVIDKEEVHNHVTGTVAFCYGTSGKKEWEQQFNQVKHADRVYFLFSEVKPYCTEEELEYLSVQRNKGNWISIPYEEAITREYEVNEQNDLRK